MRTSRYTQHILTTEQRTNRDMFETIVVTTLRVAKIDSHCKQRPCGKVRKYLNFWVRHSGLILKMAVHMNISKVLFASDCPQIINKYMLFHETVQLATGQLIINSFANLRDNTRKTTLLQILNCLCCFSQAAVSACATFLSLLQIRT